MQLGSRIRARRRQLGFTLKEVSARSGVSVPYLSQLERQQANPTVTALSNIARALGVPLTFFVPDQPHPITVIRRDARPDFQLQELPYRMQSLAGGGKDLHLEPLILYINPGFSGELNSHLGEAFLHVLSGRLILRLDQEAHELQAGDSAHHSRTIPHAWTNPTDQETVVLWVGTPRFFPD